MVTLLLLWCRIVSTCRKQSKIQPHLWHGHFITINGAELCLLAESKARYRHIGICCGMITLLLLKYYGAQLCPLAESEVRIRYSHFRGCGIFVLLKYYGAHIFLLAKNEARQPLKRPWSLCYYYGAQLCWVAESEARYSHFRGHGHFVTIMVHNCVELQKVKQDTATSEAMVTLLLFWCTIDRPTRAWPVNQTSR